MTIQARAFLRKLRKAQMTEQNTVFVDFPNMTVSTCHDANGPCTTVSIKRFQNSARSILDYLQDLGYIHYNGYYEVEVLHKGWHPSQALMLAFCGFMMKSVLTPILVSAVTTLLTMWLSGLFK